MAKLFDLGSESAGAPFSEAAIYDAGDPSCRSEREPALFDGWVALWVLQIEQFVILDEQQAVDLERRDRGETPVSSVRITCLVEWVLIGVEQFHPARAFSP
jgi:hypothetical protein